MEVIREQRGNNVKVGETEAYRLGRGETALMGEIMEAL